MLGLPIDLTTTMGLPQNKRNEKKKKKKLKKKGGGKLLKGPNFDKIYKPPV